MAATQGEARLTLARRDDDGGPGQWDIGGVIMPDMG